MKRYKVRYLPGFKQDLRNAKNYIANTLQNPSAAKALIHDTENAIGKRIEMPLAFEPVRLLFDPESTYYKIYVKNYIVYYVVIDDVIEFRRFQHCRQNVETI